MTTKNIGTHRVVALALLPLLAICLTVALNAQPLLDTAGRWQPLERNFPVFHSGLQGDRETPTSLFFRNDGLAYLTAGKRYKSTDGGFTWWLRSDDDPIPNRICADGFGIAPNAIVSYDTGATWMALNYDPADTSFSHHEEFDATVASSRMRIVAALDYVHSYMDTVAKRMRYVRAKRLVATTDGGVTWRKLDSVRINDPYTSPVALEVRPSAPFADFPRPADMPGSVGEWSSLVDMIDSTTLMAIASVRTVSPALSRRFVATIDIVAGNTVWNPLPGPSVSAFSSKVLYSYNPYDSFGAFYRTENGGASWDTIQAPSWLDLSRAFFFSNTHIVTPNGKSFDGGRTWERWATPWEGTPAKNVIFTAIDSANYILVASNSLISHSSDAGHTWSRNHALGVPTGILARDGRVVVSWAYRGVTIHNESGARWSDLGAAPGELPAELSSIWAIGYPNGAGDDSRVAGLATLTAPDGSSRMEILKSRNGGISWEEGGAFPWPANTPTSPLYASLAFQFVPNASGPGKAWVLSGTMPPFVSVDEGATWSQPGTEIVQGLAMENSSDGIALVRSLRGLAITRDGTKTWGMTHPVDSASWVIASESFGDGRYRVLMNDRELRSDDGGGTWRESYVRTDGVRPMAGRLYRLDDMRLYVANEGGLYYSPDGGRSYQRFGIPANAGMLVSAADSHYIYFAGLANQFSRWRLGDEPVSSVGDEGSVGGAVTVIVDPRAAEEAIVRYRLERPSVVGIALYDMLGNTLLSSAPAMREEGDVSEYLALRGIPSGRYMIQVRIGAGVRNVPLMIAR